MKKNNFFTYINKEVKNRNFLYKNFDNSNSYNSKFQGSSFYGNTFNKAKFKYCNFSYCKFDSVIIRNANFRGSKFINTSFSNVIFDNCKFDKCLFKNIKIKNTFGFPKKFESKIMYSNNNYEMNFSPELLRAIENCKTNNHIVKSNTLFKIKKGHYSKKEKELLKKLTKKERKDYQRNRGIKKTMTLNKEVILLLSNYFKEGDLVKGLNQISSLIVSDFNSLGYLIYHIEKYSS